MNRIKRTSIVNGISGQLLARNWLIAVGPDHDPAKDIVVITVNYRYKENA